MNAFQIQALALQLASRHIIPQSPYKHPLVFVPDGKGGVDEFMTAKLREVEDNGAPYVPYCMKTSNCMRTRRTEWGFKCPTCGNETNWDLTQWNGNANVMFEGEPPTVRAPAPRHIAPPTPRQLRDEWNKRVKEKKQRRDERRAQRNPNTE